MLSIPYAIKSLVRNKRRTLQNIFGIFLAVTIISAVIFYNETAAVQFLNEMLDDIEVDMTVSSFDLSSFAFGLELPEITYNTTDIDKWLDKQSLVESSEFFFTLSNKVRIKGESRIELATQFVGIEASYLQTFNVLSITEGIFNNTISNDTAILPVLIDDRNALKLNLKINDLINVTKESIDLTTGKLLNYTNSCRIGGIYHIEDSSSFLGLSLFNRDVGMLILPIWDLSEWQQTLYQRWKAHQLYGDYNEQLHVKFNHSLLPSNPDEAGAKTTAFSNQIMVRFGGQMFSQDNIGLSVLILRLVLLFFQMFLLFLSLPAIILALYLQKYSVESTMEMRSIEITTLQSRGASSRQLIMVILSEFSLVAIFSSILGILTGSLVAQVMLWIPQFLNIDTSLVDFDLSFSSVVSINFIVMMMIGIALTLISAYLPARRLIREQDVLEGMREEIVQRPPLWKRVYLDVVFTLSGLIFLVLQVGFNFDVQSGGLLFVLWSAVTPSLFWLGSILLLARIGSNIIFKAENLLIQGFNLVFSLGEVVAKSVSRRPESLSKAIIILALTFSFGIMVSTTANTNYLTNLSQARFSAGADLQAIPILPLSTKEFNKTLQDIDSTALVSPIHKDSIEFGGTKIPIFGVDPKSFQKVAFIQDPFFLDTTVEEVFSALSISNNSLISKDFSENYDYHATNSLAETGLVVSNIAYNFPTVSNQITQGMGVSITISTTGTSGSANYFIVVSLETFTTFFGAQNASYFLISTQIEPEKLKSQLTEVYGLSLEISTFTELLNRLEEPGIGNFNGVLTVEFVIVIIIACLGSGIFLLTAIQERKREIGTLVALGATFNQVGTFVIGEAITATIFSTLVGSAIGFIVSVLFHGFRTEPGSITSPVVFSLPGFGILLAFIIIGVTTAVLLSLWEIRRTSVSEVLRTI
ncbi:MAG: FtsX-like permease family protein [Candidatus Hodarchaeales archaeon]